MLTVEPEGTCFSSSILASSSAIGCSKSRKFTAIGAREYQRASAVDRSNARAHGWRAVEHRDPASPQQLFQLFGQGRRRPDVPVGAKGIRAAGAGGKELHGHLATA